MTSPKLQLHPFTLERNDDLLLRGKEINTASTHIHNVCAWYCETEDTDGDASLGPSEDRTPRAVFPVLSTSICCETASCAE
jgi:hypothetical protein